MSGNGCGVPGLNRLRASAFSLMSWDRFSPAVAPLLPGVGPRAHGGRSMASYRDVHIEIALPVLTWPSLTALFTFSLYLALFR